MRTPHTQQHQHQQYQQHDKEQHKQVGEFAADETGEDETSRRTSSSEGGRKPYSESLSFDLLDAGLWEYVFIDPMQEVTKIDRFLVHEVTSFVPGGHRLRPFNHVHDTTLIQNHAIFGSALGATLMIIVRFLEGHTARL